jgi:threonine dehydrogenase-like Zn-dependent dehydrogenase
LPAAWLRPGPTSELLAGVLAGTINPGRVFDVVLPLQEAPEAYRAMDERRAIKVMLTP